MDYNRFHNWQSCVTFSIGINIFCCCYANFFFRKLYKQDPIDQNIYPNQKSYWKKKDSRDIELNDQF